MPAAIELAPNWKRSLTLSHPIILASGAMADTEAGALVTLPLTLHPRGGAPPPRVVEISGGVLVRTGAANPGLKRVLRDYRRVWANSSAPIIVAFAAQAVRDWATMALGLEGVAGVAGVELQLNPTLDAANAIRETRSATELPILAKLDLEQGVAVAADCLNAGANALVIGHAPRGLAIVDGRSWYGRLYSPVVKPLILRAVAEIAALDLHAPLIACGGAHSAADVRECLAAGAIAVEIDSAAWINPQVVMQIRNLL